MKIKILLLSLVLGSGSVILAAPKKNSKSSKESESKKDQPTNATGNSRPTIETEEAFGRHNSKFTPGVRQKGARQEQYSRSNSSKGSNDSAKSTTPQSEPAPAKAESQAVPELKIVTGVGECELKPEPIERESSVSESAESSERGSSVEHSAESVHFEPSDNVYTDADFEGPTIWQVLREKFGTKSEQPKATNVDANVSVSTVADQNVNSGSSVANRDKKSALVSQLNANNGSYIIVGVSVVVIVAVAYWAYQRWYSSDKKDKKA